MTAPKVFISSTCYDLLIIRENLEKFIESLGYIPIRSDRGSIYFDTNKDVMDSCIDEVPNCQILISIIGGRFGSEYKDTGKSITNMEVGKARESKVPIFTLVDNKVLIQYELWKLNKGKDITYPNVQSTKIFEFIEEVKNASVNNALQPFDSFDDIRSYLMQQWSGMMYNFLTTESKAKQVDETLSAISEVGKKIEFITRQIALVIGTDKSKLKIKMMDLIEKSLLGWPLNSMRKSLKIEFTPENILKNDTIEKLLKSHKVKYEIETTPLSDNKTDFISIYTDLDQPAKIGKDAYDKAEKEYEMLRKKILSILKENKITIEDFLSEQKSK